MDEPAFPGCLARARLIGIIEADQREENGETMRNDRLIAVAKSSRSHRDVRDLGALNENLLAEIEHFFVSYNAVKDKQFTPRGHFGPERAHAAVREGIARFQPPGKNRYA